MVAVRGVNEVASSIVKRVEEREARLLVHRAHTEVLPLVPDAHAPQDDGGDMEAGNGRKLAVAAELGCGRGCLEVHSG